LHALAASCVQSRQFFTARCQNSYINKKMKTTLKNLRIYATHVLAKCYPSTLCMARSNLIRRYLQERKPFRCIYDNVKVNTSTVHSRTIRYSDPDPHCSPDLDLTALCILMMNSEVENCSIVSLDQIYSYV
jgi:hypothetical protein